jgi:hypothetical protein
VETHPIRLVVTDDGRRSRLTVFFRFLLVIPHWIWLALWAIAAAVVVILNWFATLITGRSPQGLHDFLARYLRYTTHVSAYGYLLANPFPAFSGAAGSYPVDLEVDPPEPQGRLGVFFRLILAIPAWIFATVLGYVVQVISLLGWFVCLVLGRMPEGMENLGLYCLRYTQQSYAYVMLLTSRYPSLGAPAAPAAPSTEPSTPPPALPE